MVRLLASRGGDVGGGGDRVTAGGQGLAESLARRTNYVNRRVAALTASVRTLRRQTAVEQELGSERERAPWATCSRRSLCARPPLHKVGCADRKGKGKRKIDRANPDRRSALRNACDERVESSGDAKATGLRPTGPSRSTDLVDAERGVPISAADSLVGDDGSATTAVDLPTGREKEMSLEMTLEDEPYSEAPNGAVALVRRAPPLAGNRARGGVERSLDLM